jgi:hypothetical protein
LQFLWELQLRPVCHSVVRDISERNKWNPGFWDKTHRASFLLEEKIWGISYNSNHNQQSRVWDRPRYLHKSAQVHDQITRRRVGSKFHRVLHVTYHFLYGVSRYMPLILFESKPIPPRDVKHWKLRPPKKTWRRSTPVVKFTISGLNLSYRMTSQFRLN